MTSYSSSHSTPLLLSLCLSALASCAYNETCETITKAEYLRMEQEMHGAVKSGWLSEEEMHAKLGELEELIDPYAVDEAETLSRGEFMRLRKEIDGMVMSGELSQEDARMKLGEMRKMVAGDRGEEPVSYTRSEYMRAKKKSDRHCA